MDKQATDVDTLLPLPSTRVDLREVHAKYIIRQNSEKDLDFVWGVCASRTLGGRGKRDSIVLGRRRVGVRSRD